MNNRDKRANNREYSTKLLTELGVNFTSHNNGAHLIIKNGDQRIDFWPGTGKWIVCDFTSRGVFNLLKFIGIQND